MTAASQSAPLFAGVDGGGRVAHDLAAAEPDAGAFELDPHATYVPKAARMVP